MIGSRAIRMMLAACLLTWTGTSASAQGPDVIHQPYRLDTGLMSRSISFENPTGAAGEGGKAASNLGPGRKGAPAQTIKPGETVQLCDIEGPGTIRHIWITTQPSTRRRCGASCSAPGGTARSIRASSARSAISSAPPTAR